MEERKSEKLAYSIAETAAVLGLSRPSVYNLIHAKDGIPVFKVGTRTLVSAAGLERWIEEQSERGGVQQ